MNYGYLVAAIGLAVLAGAYVRDLVRTSKARRLVFANLDNAKESEQFAPPCGCLYGLKAPEIAADMELYCEDASGYDRNELLPHVQRWMTKEGMQP